MYASPTSQTQALQPVIHELGIAVYLCQQFETNLLILVSLLTANEKGIVTSESFRNGFKVHSTKTLGKLAGVFQSTLSLRTDFEAYIRQGVETRNSISHGFVIRNRLKFLSIDGRSEIIDELREAQQIINERLQMLNEVLDRALRVFGGSLDQLCRDTSFRFEPDIVDEIVRH